ncbi:MAG: hypothetical protein FWD98_00185 [Defluviitaleaceae bacterium]|nr:hypothetical protein [Defluviitaleaceae bacterium]
MFSRKFKMVARLVAMGLVFGLSSAVLTPILVGEYVRGIAGGVASAVVAGVVVFMFLLFENAVPVAARIAAQGVLVGIVTMAVLNLMTLDWNFSIIGGAAVLGYASVYINPLILANKDGTKEDDDSGV